MLEWNLRGLGSKEAQRDTTGSFPMRSLTWRSPAAVRVIRLRREVHAKACAKQDMLFFSFLLTRLSVSNLAFTNFPNMSLQPYPSLRSFLKKNAVGLWRGWLGNSFSQPDLVRHRRLGVCFLISNKTVFVFMKVCICGWLQSKQPPGLHDETLETTRPHWSAGVQPSTVFAFLLREPI